MEGAHWEHYPHKADMGIRGFGATLEEAFVQAALAMTAVISDPEAISPNKAVEITCTAPDAEILFIDWLNGLIYEMATRKMLFSRFQVAITGNQLAGRAWGESVNPTRHTPSVEIKGATYTDLKVAQEQDGDGWVAQCVVDV